MTDFIDALDAAYEKASRGPWRPDSPNVEGLDGCVAETYGWANAPWISDIHNAWPRLRDVLRAAERAERVLGGGEGLPDGRPDTYSQRCSAAMWMIHKALYTLKKGGA